MSRYKVEISGVNTAALKVLTNKEMKELFVRLQNGEKEAKDILIEGNLKLVLSIVQRFSSRCENMDDLFQVGCIGLVKSIDNFDLKHEVRFSTYAVPMIMGEIKRYLRDNQVIRVSRHLKDLAYKAFKLKEEYIHEHQHEPSTAYLAAQLEVKEKDIVDALDSVQSVISIFEPVYNSDGDELYLMDQIRDDKDEIALLENVLALKNSMKALNPKEMDIIKKRYYDDMTQTEIASELGISQAQVSRLEKSAIAVLKKNFN
ncbi:MAG: SigB/SigF/SigG family RNA polymerase sigma factor [Erysipelotrichaceae bacterium]|uniref:RNA polymerase sigma factor n=1 Tax=Copranaerobaculum intestinale TaxID=2692629 RepID=A0A6N8UDC9_9FIRM|nr:SigB/SigF/SigG family RNA polymerase sigma factor [Copranaerobaculum intestinale]MBS6373226.1 SigB/SigF/SigG family RNA polymerase sigma factor [Erysipelotrichaceae bacterium]MXQ73507.1 SigB/SigF/SigG family RNA polymerase sigma factor [Copranaerobaculum intestinale]